MNKVVLMGRLCDDPAVRYSENGIAVARYRLAVSRRNAKEGEQSADYINITALGKSGEFIEKYVHKGTKLVVVGHIQSGSYVNKDGVKVYTTEVVAEEQEFAESKKDSDSAPEHKEGEFMNIPEGIEEDLPFSQPK